MTEEDEAFNEIERQAKQRKESVRVAMLKVEDKWIETNNSVCALLRQAHDVLAMSSLPPKRRWIGLTVEEVDQGLCRTNYATQTAGAWRDGVEWATEQLKERNA